MAPAAELALKFAYELDRPGKSALSTHNLHVLFTKLKEGKQKDIEDAYQALLKEQ